MSDILTDYREWRDKQQERIGTHSDRCHLYHERCMIHRLAAALAAEQAKRTPDPHATPGEGTSHDECTNHDAVPAAIVSAPDESSLHAVSELGNPGAASRQGDVTGSTQEPVAWTAWFPDEAKPDGDFCWPAPHDQARRWCERRNAKLVPLYRSPTLTDAEREAIEKAIGRELDAEWYGGPEPERVATLRRLLGRLG